MKISAERLKEIIESHGKWLHDEKGGQRADLRGADLRDADLPDGIYQVVGCGSVNRCTTYDSINDRVICGCWNDNNDNHLAAFEQRIEDVYGINGEQPDTNLYSEYMAAVTFFKTVKGDLK